jgi:coenzyme F420 hydrogenase subunit beta
MTEFTSIKAIVDAGLCIGCGLCEALAKNVTMQPDVNGSLRPFPLFANEIGANEKDAGFTREEEQLCSSVCPGIHIRPADVTSADVAGVNDSEINTDEVWGRFRRMQYAWATDADTRFIGSTGGVLTALGQYLVDSQQVDFVYHVRADDTEPLKSHPCFSETAEQVLAAAGSRYGPVAPLSALHVALERNRPFAVIAKPCDLSAIENLAASDERVNRLIKFRLTLVCGGQSTATKAQNVLADAGINESSVTLYRHRGHGNPGPTRIETRDNRSVEYSYQQLWENEAGWSLEPRCKLCADALGECADIAAADVWPGGSPTGEDEGFNGIVVRTGRGQALIDDAERAGYLKLGEQISCEEFNQFQPHQVSKKIALKWRYLGLRKAGLPVIDAPFSRLDILGERLPPDQREQETNGTLRRFTDQ